MFHKDFEDARAAAKRMESDGRGKYQVRWIAEKKMWQVIVSFR